MLNRLFALVLHAIHRSWSVLFRWTQQSITWTQTMIRRLVVLSLHYWDTHRAETIGVLLAVAGIILSLAAWIFPISTDTAAADSIAKYRLGIISLRNGDYFSAYTFFDEAHRIYGANALASCLYFTLGVDGDAFTTCNSAIDHEPTNSDLYAARCYFYASTWPLDAAIDDCTKALKFDPSNRFASLAQCLTHYRRGESDAAAAACEQSLDANPKDGLALGIRCLLRGEQKQWENALIDCDESQIQLKRSDGSHTPKCALFWMKGNLDAAALECEAANGTSFAGVNSTAGLCRIYAERRLDAKSIEYCNKFLESNALDTNVLTTRCLINFRNDREDLAFPDCARAFYDLHADSPEIYWLMCSLLGHQGYLEAAIQVCDKGEARYPEDTDMAQLRCFQYSLKGQANQVMSDCEKGLREETPRVYINRCHALLQGKRWVEAIEDCKKALERMKGSDVTTQGDKQDALIAIGFSYLALNRIGDASRTFGQALLELPKSPSALYGRGLVKDRQNPGSGASDIARAINLQRDILDHLKQLRYIQP